ncbi:MAG TPA: hypothetical protein ENJ27_01390 [Candidatus Moranbacteria bacterium]|nr:hypothetical protein [Candidatus Moranbacteria bacterium]
MLDKYKNNKDEALKNKRSFAMQVFLYLIIVIFIGGLSFVGWKYFDNKNNVKNENKIAISKKLNTQNKAKNKNSSSDEEKIVDKITKSNNLSNDISSSKNYKIKQLKFGGNIILGGDEDRNIPLKIYDVKSEIVTAQEDGEPKFLITWKTNKAAISDVIYSKNDGSKSKTIAEDGYGFDHSVLLKNMDFATIYIYKIKSKDRWQNKISTEYFSAYTGAKSESIFDLIFNAVHDVFGWAMRK